MQRKRDRIRDRYDARVRCAGQEWRIRYLRRWGTARREHRAGRLDTSCRVMRVTDDASTCAPLPFKALRVRGRRQGKGREGKAKPRATHAVRTQEVRRPRRPSGAQRTGPNRQSRRGRRRKAPKRCHGNRGKWRRVTVATRAEREKHPGTVLFHSFTPSRRGLRAHERPSPKQSGHGTCMPPLRHCVIDITETPNASLAMPPFPARSVLTALPLGLSAGRPSLPRIRSLPVFKTF